MSVWVVAIGATVTAVGAGVAAKGAADNAAAVGKANAANSNNEADLYLRQSGMLDSLIDKKNKKLQNLGNIFERFNSTGAFGNTDTLRNLRKAQEDYSALAAGDFSGFESQLRQSLSDSLIATAGSGAPIGTFAGLAAQDQMQLRGQGVQTAVGISEYLSKEASQLLGQEFGIMDQSFNTQYQLDRTKVTNVNNYSLGQAGTVGVATQAYGQAAQQVGSSLVSYGMNKQNQQTIKDSNYNAMGSALQGTPRATVVQNADGSYPSAMSSHSNNRPTVSSYGNVMNPKYPGGGTEPPTTVPVIDLPNGVVLEDHNDVSLLPPLDNKFPAASPSYDTYSPLNYSAASRTGDGMRNDNFYTSLYQPNTYPSSSSLLNSVGASIAAR